MNITTSSDTVSLDSLIAIAPARLDGPVKVLSGSVVVRAIASKPGSFGVDATLVTGEKVSAFYGGDVGLTRLARLAQLVKHSLTENEQVVTLRAKTRTVAGRDYLDLDA